MFVRDLAAGRTLPVSVADGAGATYGNGPSEAPSIDATGARVAFHSAATNLGDGDTDPTIDVHVRDLAAGRTLLASVAGPVKGNGPSGDASISGDGRRVAFDSGASNLHAADTDTESDIFLRDLAAGTTALVSRNGTAGAGLAGSNYRPAMSLDGSAVAFRSSGSGLLPGDDPDELRGFVKRLASGELVLATRATGAAGLVADDGVSGLDVDADGSCVAFDTRAGNLASFPVPGDVASVWMRVLGAGCPDPAAAPPPPPGTDTTKPVLTAVKLSRTRFRVGKQATPRSAAAKRGTTLRFTVSEAATLRIVVGRRAAGRRVQGRCKPPTRKLRTRPRCVRWVKRGTLTRAVPAGAGRVAFSGRIGRKALRRGRHRFALVAVDAAGNRSAPRKVKFRIVRR